MFLLRYMDSLDLRRTIGVATNKSERWNKFLQWVNFGGRGLIAEAARDEQRKLIKYIFPPTQGGLRRALTVYKDAVVVLRVYHQRQKWPPTA